MKFRRKPIVVEAKQWFFHGDIPGVVVPSTVQGGMCQQCGKAMKEHGMIRSDGSTFVLVCPGDWIITDASGKSYSCKPDEFKREYEPVISPIPTR